MQLQLYNAAAAAVVLNLVLVVAISKPIFFKIEYVYFIEVKRTQKG
eukprot:SAG11_NODE_1284_length_5305_cov_1.528621_8_plen_46_part_00